MLARCPSPASCGHFSMHSDVQWHCMICRLAVKSRCIEQCIIHDLSISIQGGCPCFCLKPRFDLPVSASWYCTVEFIDPAMKPVTFGSYGFHGSPCRSVQWFFAGDTMWFHDQAVRYTTGMRFWRLRHAAAWNEILPIRRVQLEGTSTTFVTSWRALCSKFWRFWS